MLRRQRSVKLGTKVSHAEPLTTHLLSMCGEVFEAGREGRVFFVERWEGSSRRDEGEDQERGFLAWGMLGSDRELGLEDARWSHVWEKWGRPQTERGGKNSNTPDLNFALCWCFGRMNIPQMSRELLSADI